MIECNRQAQAEFHRLALIMGLEHQDDVVAWADAVILEDHQPDRLFLNVSVAKDRPRLVEALGAISLNLGATALNEAYRLLANALNCRLDEGNITPDEVASLLYLLVRSGDRMAPRWGQFADWVNDEFFLVRTFVKERAPAEYSLRRFLVEEGRPRPLEEEPRGAADVDRQSRDHSLPRGATQARWPRALPRLRGPQVTAQVNATAVGAEGELVRSREIQSFIDTVQAVHGPVVPYGSGSSEQHSTCFKIPGIPATISVHTQDGNLPSGQYDIQIEGVPPGDYIYSTVLSLDAVMEQIARLFGPGDQWPGSEDDR